MKKIHFKIISLVLFCLIVLGVFMSFISIIELRSLGEKNIGTLDTKLREDFDRMAQSQVESAIGIIQHLYGLRDEMGEDIVKETARQMIVSMRYGEDGYVFVYNSKGDAIAMLGGDFEGTNRWDLKDANGNYIIRDIVQAGKDGTGFTDYWYAKPGETEASPKRSYSQYFSSWDWVVGTGNYTDDIDAIINLEEEKTNAAVFRTILIIVFSDLGVMFAAIILSWFIGKKISRPVEYLAVEARKVASGDLTVDIQVNTTDETGDLAQAFNEMIARFNSILNGIIQTAEEINQNSNEVSTASQEVASGASEQASSAEEISASMEELSANIQQNTDNSRQSNDIVSQAAEDAFSGGKAVEETVDSMKFISEKINIIEDIARNTNMLALNAAIEAARAGEAGKGFAVVASEVRKLAEHSQAAANDITQVSFEGVKKADYTKELMNNMVPSIRKSAEIAEEIMEGSDEQAKGALQINAALLEMDKVIQSNAASSEEIAAMAEQLKKKSDDLNKMVSYFSIKGGMVKKKTAALPAPAEVPRKTAVLEVVPEPVSNRQLEDDEFTDF